MNDVTVNAKTGLYAILGDPVSHCMSPVIMNRSFQRLHMDCVFIALRCAAADVDVMMRALRTAGLRGYVFTMPVKELVSPYLDELRDEAKLTGAVNCVQNIDGRLIGYNTDSLGFWSAVQERNEEKTHIGKVFIMGMGGFAKAAAAQAALRGVHEIVAANRFGETRYVDSFQAFAKRLRERVPKVHIRLVDWEPPSWKAELADSGLVVNATSNGLNGVGDLERQFPYDALPATAVFFDAIYTPVKTAFLTEAQRRGHRIAGGLDLLAHQGVCSFRIWTGSEVKPELMRADALDFLTQNH